MLFCVIAQWYTKAIGFIVPLGFLATSRVPYSSAFCLSQVFRQSFFSVSASSSVSCTPARPNAQVARLFRYTPLCQFGVPLWEKKFRRFLAGKSLLVVQFSAEKNKRKWAIFFWFESALILVLCDKQKGLSNRGHDLVTRAPLRTRE